MTAGRLVTLLFALAGCEERPSRPPLPPREPARPPVAFRRGDAAAAGVASVENPVAATLDAGPRPVPEAVTQCVARGRRALPPELADALGVLGTASLLEDACRLDVAPRLRSPELCEAVGSSALREACAARAAVALGAPERCPPTPGLRGRDPVCVAVAAGSPALCAAAPGGDRGRCLALAHADGRACERLDPLFRAPCARDLAAMGAWLAPRRGDALPDASATLDLVDPGDLDASLRAWELRAHRRGAWLDDEGFLWLVDPSAGWPRATQAAGDEPVVALRVSTTGVQPGAPVAAEARVLLPGALALDTAEGNARATATFVEVPRRRGDRFTLAARVEGARAGLASAVALRVGGFVRDVVPAAMLR